ncbi:hypothetical protein ABTX34_22430 [Streptomyces sp. NPDC096538]|uniref:hypothetical protein n=1 Tax=Streptomyces sp. NPDC096538 TaxID=3155427 RepID=UPI0033336FC7
MVIDPAEIDLFDFLTRWLGAPSPQGRPLPGDATWLPEPLREWHSLTSRWNKFPAGVNRVIQPSRIRMERGKAVFMTDATGDWSWAFDSNNPNRIYEGEPGGEWRQVPEDLPQFLTHATVTEVIALAAFRGLGDQVPDEALDAVLAPMREVGFGAWQWPRPGYRNFMSDSLIASVGPAVEPTSPWLNRDGYSAVRISGNSPSVLAYLDADTVVRWIHLQDDELED